MRYAPILVTMAAALAAVPAAASGQAEANAEQLAIMPRLDLLLPYQDRPDGFPVGPWSKPSLPPELRQLITLDDLVPRNADGVPLVFERRGWFERVSLPDVAAGKLEQAVLDLAFECRFNAAECARSKRFASAAAGLRQAHAANPACSTAAKNFDPYYAAGQPPTPIAAAFDLECLGSFARRVKGGVAEDAPDIPALFRTGGARGDVQGALRLIAILDDDNGPFCGGLLQEGGRLVTARHCLTHNRASFDQGRVRVRSADGTLGPWTVSAPPPVAAASSGFDVAADWTVMTFAADRAYLLPHHKVAQLEEFGELTLAGHYAYFQAVSYADGYDGPPWALGLRFPKTGLCRPIEIVSGCLQISCQTVRGFSGMPLFAKASGDAGSPLHIVGFVSGGNWEGAKCTTLVPGETLAVSADMVKLN